MSPHSSVRCSLRSLRLSTARDPVRIVPLAKLAPRGSRLAAAYFVVTRGRKSMSPPSSSARRRAIRLRLRPAPPVKRGLLRIPLSLVSFGIFGQARRRFRYRHWRSHSDVVRYPTLRFQTICLGPIGSVRIELRPIGVRPARLRPILLRPVWIWTVRLGGDRLPAHCRVSPPSSRRGTGCRITRRTPGCSGCGVGVPGWLQALIWCRRYRRCRKGV